MRMIKLTRTAEVEDRGTASPWRSVSRWLTTITLAGALPLALAVIDVAVVDTGPGSTPQVAAGADRATGRVGGPLLVDGVPPPNSLSALRLARSSWPSATNTGVPAGTTLRSSGSLSLRTDNQVVDGLDITGCVNVYAQNVKIMNTRINCDSRTYAIRTFRTAANLLVQDVEIDGSGTTSAAVCCSNYTLRRVDIHDTIDGPRLDQRVAVIDSWIHDLTRVPNSHNDALQTTGGQGILIRHNALEPYRRDGADPMNACLMIGSTTSSSVSDLVMTDNYCNGGNWSIGVRKDLVGKDIVFTGNRFGRDYRYGVIARPHQAGIHWNCATNVWFDTGLPVAPCS